MPSSAHLESLALRLQHVPHLPGCYLWKNARGEVIYVGKAKDLRARMRQYVSLTDERLMIPRLMDETADFEYVVVASESDALVLERELIAEHHPYFNVDFKDDKSYPYIALTKHDGFPALKYTREKHRSGVKYFGPYTDARAARTTIDTLRKIIPICTATCAEWRRCMKQFDQLDRDFAEFSRRKENARPCFDAHIGLGPGVCAGRISPEEYALSVQAIERFLQGHRKELFDSLEADIDEAASMLDFERAERLQRRMTYLEQLEHRYQVVLSEHENVDVVGLYREETLSAVCLLVIREGKLIRTTEFMLDKGADIPSEELLYGFLTRYFDESSDIPRELCIPEQLIDEDLLVKWLADKAGRQVQLRVPQRGAKKRLLDMAATNAKHAFMRYAIKTGYTDQRSNQALMELESALALPAAPYRIECYDISTLHGHFTVASMVVFINGRPEKKLYRRFKIQTKLQEADDFASMYEVLTRRFEAANREGSDFSALPDLLVVDGGKPQLSVALRVLKEQGIELPVCGLAKADEEVFVTWDEFPVVLPSGSASLYLLKQVRDESHRFAITFHRQLRSKAFTQSVLDHIDGIGPKRKHLLMKHFGSLKKLKEATVADLSEVEGISDTLAESLYRQLRALEED